MSEEYTQSTLIESARRLVKLHEEPEPGFATWHMMAQQHYEDLRNNVFAEEARRKGDSIPDEEAPEWENVYYNVAGYEIRLLGGTLQQRKLPDAIKLEKPKDG